MNSMRILLGTTNPSKVKRFSDLLQGYDVEFVTLKDLAITDVLMEDRGCAGCGGCA